ncbi:hypothetical protein AYI68_g1950 [Smittium mucronatum]|uniref:Uncharacterized protein n=1 Tax=Smittium mucronatum TaxID=133383 RepID=A0A1R0H423_9FUNG|nr:hypothetical protein AYI68_g1950 [Smittium mucronatum]
MDERETGSSDCSSETWDIFCTVCAPVYKLMPLEVLKMSGTRVCGGCCIGILRRSNIASILCRLTAIFFATRASSASLSIRGLVSDSVRRVGLLGRTSPLQRLSNLVCVTVVAISARRALIVLENKTLISSEIFSPGVS